jgi:serine protease Do
MSTFSERRWWTAVAATRASRTFWPCRDRAGLLAFLAGILFTMDVEAAEFVDILPTIEPSIVYISPQPGASGRTEPSTSGSGVVIRPDGFILTVDHLVGGPVANLEVRTADGRSLLARVVGADKRSGVAVLRVDASNLVPAAIGRSSELRRAEPVWAVGRLPSALSGEVVVTSGIISATGRASSRVQPFVQSTAQFHPSMGGGGLFNGKGQLVAINSQFWKPAGDGNIVVSFSIPIDEASRIANDLILFGRIERGALGLQIDRVTKEVAEALGLKDTSGALVRDAKQGAAGQRAGLAAGDIVLAINGQPIEEATDLPFILGTTKPGDQLRLRVFRKGGYLELNAVADAAP